MAQPTRTVTFEHDGLTFSVDDIGSLDAPAVVLLHGFPQDASAWDEVLPALHDACLRTLTFDQRGYGPANTPHEVRAYGIQDLAGDVVALLDAAGIEVAHVVGHDWGGAVAWHLAGSCPTRLHSVTVLSTPHPAALFWSFTHSRQALSSYYMAAFQLPRLPERFLSPRLFRVYRTSGLPEHHAVRYAERFADPASLTGPINWYRAAVRHRATTRRSRVPTTYLWGRHDFALGAAAAHRTKQYVRSDYRFVETDAGHWIPETHAGVVAEEIVRQVRG